MKTISFKQLCDEIHINFVEVAKERRELKENEYYALVVVEDYYGENSPYVRGVEVNTHKYLVGIEKCSGVFGWYISKNYGKRNDLSRGITIIVEVSDIAKFIIL